MIVPRTKMTITAAEEKKKTGFVRSLSASCSRSSMSGTFSRCVSRTLRMHHADPCDLCKETSCQDDLSSTVSAPPPDRLALLCEGARALEGIGRCEHLLIAVQLSRTH